MLREDRDEEKEINMKTIYDVIIIGSGISGLATVHFLQKMRPDLRVLLLEKSERAGGAIKSFFEDGFLAECGPHGFLDNVEESREILRDTGLEKEAQPVPLGDFRRFVCHQGKLVALPQKPQSMLTTPLLSVKAKLRLLGDLWMKPCQEDQTIAEWAEYRFGKGVLPLVDVAVIGTFSGDYQRLSIDAVMPGVRRLEKEHGSIFRGLKAKKKKSKRSGPLPAMKNFAQGLERLVEVPARDREIVFNSSVRWLNRQDDGCYHIDTAKKRFSAHNVVMGLPVNPALSLLSKLSTPPVAAIPVSRIFNVALGFTDRAQIPYGFGYLAPERENRFALGALFSSQMFPGRAPAGHVLLEALVGGRRHPEKLELADEEIIKRVLGDLKQLIDLPEPPVFSRVLKPTGGIPQLEMDHPRLLEWRRALEHKEKGLYICGFGWDGIGINDMTKSARRVAEAIVAGGRGEAEKDAVKGVYF